VFRVLLKHWLQPFDSLAEYLSSPASLIDCWIVCLSMFPARCMSVSSNSLFLSHSGQTRELVMQKSGLLSVDPRHCNRVCLRCHCLL